jgi:hypothetical protein
MAREALAHSLRAQGGHTRRYLYRRRNALSRAWREERDHNRLVPDPVFIMCSVRSGSTLLRSVLDTHTQICAPHELHLNTMRVSTPRDYAIDSWRTLGYEITDLENMLWDRALHRMLVASSKRIVVDKTPQNAAIWPRIRQFWPQARYIHLRRHPVGVLESLMNARPDKSVEENTSLVLEYCWQLDSAREALPGPTVRYEDLTADPERVTRELCEYLEVGWQRRMLQYKKGAFKGGLGDWSANIKSGRIQPARALPAPDEVPPALRKQARAWCYM